VKSDILESQKSYIHIHLVGKQNISKFSLRIKASKYFLLLYSHWHLQYIAT